MTIITYSQLQVHFLWPHLHSLLSSASTWTFLVRVGGGGAGRRKVGTFDAAITSSNSSTTNGVTTLCQVTVSQHAEDIVRIPGVFGRTCCKYLGIDIRKKAPFLWEFLQKWKFKFTHLILYLIQLLHVIFGTYIIWKQDICISAFITVIKIRVTLYTYNNCIDRIYFVNISQTYWGCAPSAVWCLYTFVTCLFTDTRIHAGQSLRRRIIGLDEGG